MAMLMAMASEREVLKSDLFLKKVLSHSFENINFQPDNVNARFRLIIEYFFDFDFLNPPVNFFYFQDLKTGYLYGFADRNVKPNIILKIDNQIYSYTLNPETLFYENPTIISLPPHYVTILEDIVNVNEIKQQVLKYNMKFMELCYLNEEQSRIHLRHSVIIKKCLEQPELVLGFTIINNNGEIISALWLDGIQPINEHANQSVMKALSHRSVNNTINNFENKDYELRINRFTNDNYRSVGMGRIMTAILINIISVIKICNKPVRRIISEAVNPISVWLLVYYFQWKMLPIESKNDIKYLLLFTHFPMENFIQNRWKDIKLTKENKDQFINDLNEQFEYMKNVAFTFDFTVFVTSTVSEQDVQIAKQIEDEFFRDKTDLFCKILKIGDQFYNVTSFEEHEDERPVDMSDLVDNVVETKKSALRQNDITGGRQWKQKSKKHHKTKATKQNTHFRTKQKRRQSLKRKQQK